MFHRDAGYLEGRRVRRSREMRAMATRTAFGRELLSGPVGGAEFGALVRALVGRACRCPTPCSWSAPSCCWSSSATDDGRGRARGWPSCGPDPDELADLWHQLVEALLGLARRGPRPRRPVGVQPAGPRGAAGRDRPAAGGRRGRQPARAASSWPATCTASPSGSPARGLPPRWATAGVAARRAAGQLGCAADRDTSHVPRDGRARGRALGLTGCTSARPIGRTGAPAHSPGRA